MGWQRSLAAGGGRDALLRIPVALCIQLQRLLPAADDGAVAADAARNRNRVARTCGESGLGGFLRFDFLCLEHTVGYFFRRGSRQRSARRATGPRWLLFRASLDKLQSERHDWNS